jgi:hypothetical protein
MTPPEVVKREGSLVRIDPQALLSQALAGGATIEALERLIALAERVQASQARQAWHEAMCRFHEDCPRIMKTSKATIKTDRAEYSYKYAELGEIMDVVGPILGKHGLSLRWTHPRVEPNAVVVECVIAHDLGHEERSGEVVLPISRESRMNSAQAVGSVLTYAKRYAALAALGIAPDDDDDGESSDSAGRDETPVETPRVYTSTGQIKIEGKVNPTCPTCAALLYRSKPEMGGGWFCWRARGGCGAKFAEDDPRLVAEPPDPKPLGEPF